MKKILSLTLIALATIALISVTSCTKEGPAGLPGTTGTNGVNGEDGIDGTDGTATCIECHSSSQGMFAKINQWEASKHATGSTFERNTGDCATCHTSQGYLGKLDGSYDHTADGAMINNPNPVNCYTCHTIHDTYTTDDWGLTTSTDVALMSTEGAVYSGGASNVCAECHQSRVASPMPVIGGDSVQINSPYWGAHHGPQANMVVGVGGFGIEAKSDFHQNIEDGCKTCHMATAYGDQAGGHTMDMTYLYHGHDAIRTQGCISCHDDEDPNILNNKIEETQTEITELLAQLETMLIEKGYMDEAYHIIPDTYSPEQAGAVLNFNFVREDRSNGIHNSDYAKALLNKSIGDITE